jgi:hypothetical protein
MSVVNPDFLHPIYTGDKNRDEILLIEYDGFIKNISEGIIYVMLHSKEKWIEKYPNIIKFEGLDKNEIYENSVLYTPSLFLQSLSDYTLQDSIIQDDLSVIENEIDVINQCITVFECALFKLLHDDIVTKCFIVNQRGFRENEISYIRETYKDVFNKITLINGDIVSAFEKEDPTTIFLNDTDVLFGRFVNGLSDDKLKLKMFILRNTYENMVYSDEDKVYTYLYSDIIKELNDRRIYGIGRMYTFHVDDNVEFSQI